MRAPRHRYTWDQYLLVEEASTIKHEFFDGDIYAMAGGTAEHAALSTAVIISLGAQLRGGPCRVFSSDLRIRVVESGLGTYPDVSVICGELHYDPPSKRTTVLNPRLVVEVLCDSTEDYDRGAKFEHYRSIESLQEYVLVSHRERLIEVFRRADEGAWARSEARQGDRLRLFSVSAELNVDEIYADVALDA